LRGRQRHLYDDFVERNRYITPSVLETVVTAYNEYIRKNLPLINQEDPPRPHEFQKVVNQVYGRVLQGQALNGDGKPGDEEAKIRMHIKTLANAVEAVMGDLKLYTPIRYNEFPCPTLKAPYLPQGPGFTSWYRMSCAPCWMMPTAPLSRAMITRSGRS
jgi:hypothetical protein